MAQIATYTLEQFIADIREVFATIKDPRAQAQAVAEHTKKILAVPGWLEEKIDLPAEGGYGRADLYVDDERGHPGTGFLLMCSIQAPGVKPGEAGTVPHDHGASWVVYGVYKGAIEQTVYNWSYSGGAWASPQVKESTRFVQREGEVAYFLPGVIHKTLNASNGRSLVLRVEAQKLDWVTRHRYNLESNSAILQKAAP